MIHGMVDRPLIFTMDELKRLPYVSRIHFIECLGNRARPDAQNRSGNARVDQLRRMDRRAALSAAQGGRRAKRGVLDRGRRRGRSEGLVQHPAGEGDGRLPGVLGQNGEPLRPQQGFPLRLIVPGFEGIYQIKYLRRIKVVDRYYMTYDDYGHINPDPKVAALTHQIGPKSVITFPSGGQKLPGPGFYEISGLAWSGAGAIRGVEVSTDGGQSWKTAELRSPAYPNGAYPIRLPLEVGRQRVHADVALHGRTGHAFSRRAPKSRNTGTSLSTKSGFAAPTIPFNRGRSPATGAFTMGLPRLFLVAAILGICQTAWAQSPTYGVGQDPDRRGNPRLGHLHQPDRKRASAGARDGQGRRGALCAEGVRADATGPTGHREATLPR